MLERRPPDLVPHWSALAWSNPAKPLQLVQVIATCYATLALITIHQTQPGPQPTLFVGGFSQPQLALDHF